MGRQRGSLHLAVPSAVLKNTEIICILGLISSAGLLILRPITTLPSASVTVYADASNSTLGTAMITEREVREIHVGERERRERERERER